MNDNEKRICEIYSSRDDKGLVHCNECPLVVDKYSHLCKANACFNEETQEWELK